MENLKSNKLSEIFEWFCESISSVYDEKEGRSVARLVFEHYYQISYVDLQLHKGKLFSESEIVHLYKIIKKLCNNTPVQHITGIAWFRKLVLKVNEKVLIPRPETEELVQWVVDDVMAADLHSPLNIWDIGTGSGAIAVSLASELLGATVWATDISESALEVASENADSCMVNVTFEKADLLLDTAPRQRFHIIVSNPPYVRQSEMMQMRKNVLDHEPHNALFVPDDDPLLFYWAIALKARDLLVSGGKIYVEINESLGEETAALFVKYGYADVTIRKDIFGKDRFIRAEKKEENSF